MKRIKLNNNCRICDKEIYLGQELAHTNNGVFHLECYISKYKDCEQIEESNIAVELPEVFIELNNEGQKIYEAFFSLIKNGLNFSAEFIKKDANNLKIKINHYLENNKDNIQMLKMGAETIKKLEEVINYE